MAVKRNVYELCEVCGQPHARRELGFVWYSPHNKCKPSPVPCPPRRHLESEVIYIAGKAWSIEKREHVPQGAKQ